MRDDGQRYCTYCRTRQPEDTFMEVRDRRTGRLVNHRCGRCQEFRKMPIKARDEKARREREARKAHAAARNRLDRKDYGSNSDS